ncbi:hypothetical protein D9M69_637040 [compost metagenome]
MTPFIEDRIIWDDDLAISSRRNACGDFALCQCISKPAGVIPLVCQQSFCFGKGVEHFGGSFVIAHLPFAQKQDEWPTVTVADGMQLGVQATLGAPDTSGNIPFFSRLAAVR